MRNDLILTFAYHFPPENAIGAARPYRFYKYLQRLGYRCHVITAADTSERPDLDAETVPDPFVAGPREGVGWQLERGARKLFLPGVSGMQWALHAYRAALRVIQREQNSRVTIFSTFPPLGTHLAAYWLARRTGLPWIADYRDPLADNPADSGWNDLSKALYRKIERIFVTSADLTIANTDAELDKLTACYPEYASRVRLLWNGFDPEQRPVPLPRPERDYQLVSHVGELYGNRNISPILYSMDRLIRSGRLAEKFKVHLVGVMERALVPDPDFMSTAEQEGWLRTTPQRVPQSEAHAIMGSSDGLLLIQPQSALQVPAKLFDYLQIGSPILAYVPPDSPVERILRKSGVPFECVYAGGDAAELDSGLERFLNLLGVRGEPSVWFEREFSAENQVQTLSEWIQTVQNPHSFHAEQQIVAQAARQEIRQ